MGWEKKFLEFECMHVEKETEKALQVVISNETFWVPKSQIGEEYLDVFTEALNTVSQREITEGLYIAVEVFREKVANPPAKFPRDRRGRSPSGKSKGRPRGTG